MNSYIATLLLFFEAVETFSPACMNEIARRTRITNSTLYKFRDVFFGLGYLEKTGFDGRGSTFKLSKKGSVFLRSLREIYDG